MNWKISNIEKKLNNIIHTVIAFCFFIILLLAIILVILRYIFNTTLLGGNEIMEYLFIYTTALGASLAIAKKEHIKITYVIDKFPFNLRKIIDVICYLLITFINAVMIYYSFEWIGTVGNHTSPVLHIPNWIMQMIVPISCGLTALYCLYLSVVTILGEKEDSESTA
jgi:TRAP-type C4-dicarboxylate transport system permease small subunit